MSDSVSGSLPPGGDTFEKHGTAFRTWLKNNGYKWDNAARVSRRLATFDEVGFNVVDFHANPIEHGSMVLAALKALPEGVQGQCRVALNRFSEYLGVDARFLKPRPVLAAAKSGPEATLAALERHLVLKVGREPITAHGHVQQLRFLAREYGLDLTRFARNDLAAMDEAEAVIMARVTCPTSPQASTINHDIDALVYLAEFVGVELELTKRPSRYVLDPDPLTLDEVRRLLRVQLPTAWRQRITRALVQWFRYSVKRRGESARVDVGDFDLSRDGEPNVQIRHPGKRGSVHRVLLPGHLLSPKRPFGAYYRWRLALDPAEIKRGSEDAFWLSHGADGLWRRATPAFLADSIIDAGKLVGVRANSTRLRKTGLTAIANGPTSDIVDAQQQANHGSTDSTLSYVKRTEQQRRKRIAAAQKDAYNVRNDE